MSDHPGPAGMPADRDLRGAQLAVRPLRLPPATFDDFATAEVRTGGTTVVARGTVHAFLTSMDTDRADFVFTVSRDFVRTIQTPLLMAPDDVPAHTCTC